METSHAQMVSLIWNIADDVLRDVFVRGQFCDVIQPMFVLRRLDALLEPTKKAFEEEYAYQTKEGIKDEDGLKEISGHNLYNTSKCTLSRLKSQATGDNDVVNLSSVPRVSDGQMLFMMELVDKKLNFRT